MTDPPRLLDEGADDFELDVLRSAATDAAPTASLSATLAAVARAGGAIAPVATAGAATGTAAKGAAASAGTIAAGAATKALLVKGLLVGVIASGLAVGYAVHRRASSEIAPPAGSSGAVTTTNEVAPSASERAPIAVASAAATPEAEAEPKPEAKPEPSSAPSTHSPRAAKRAREATAEPSVTEQIISLDRVRAAIAARDGGRALRELDRHDREFAGGVLGPEATALRIEAWIIAGDRAKATALAEQFLRTPAGGAHATRIRSLLGSSEGASNPKSERGTSNP